MPSRTASVRASSAASFRPLITIPGHVFLYPKPQKLRWDSLINSRNEVPYGWIRIRFHSREDESSRQLFDKFFFYFIDRIEAESTGKNWRSNYSLGSSGLGCDFGAILKVES